MKIIDWYLALNATGRTDVAAIVGFVVLSVLAVFLVGRDPYTGTHMNLRFKRLRRWLGYKSRHGAHTGARAKVSGDWWPVTA